MATRNRFFVAFSTVLVASVSLGGSSTYAQTVPVPVPTVPVPVTINYTFDIPLAKLTPNPCTNGFTLVSGTAHLVLAATTSSTGFQLAVQLGSTGNGIDVSSNGTPLVMGALPQYLYDSELSTTTAFPEGVPEYYERTLTANDFLIRDSLFETNDSYVMNTTFRMIFSNGLPSVPVLESVEVACE